ncbi:hypothetical protein SAMN05660964_03557 [Thiothrix caldifontis]|jgi:hypothetical protein|uniref:Uncharacterized protein n=1 Tax=Thiothrix caldifontis TaxID=525918 RepID=A0A1H4GLC2_9GAMM|nr:hypothetical protein [Thiothrix caldifontis]SEB10439.1 hypothetical protein SAMN05660964_03557 [Thiothrix caldifontis]
MEMFFVFGVILLLRWAMNRAGIKQDDYEWTHGHNPHNGKTDWHME